MLLGSYPQRPGPALAVTLNYISHLIFNLTLILASVDSASEL